MKGLADVYKVGLNKELENDDGIKKREIQQGGKKQGKYFLEKMRIVSRQKRQDKEYTAVVSSIERDPSNQRPIKDT